MEKIVIMLSTYNGEKYLSEQLESIYSQDLNGFEVFLLVRDDGSQDSTMHILKSWENKINIIYSQDKLPKNIGPAKSFWTLFINAPSADYYAFVDQDDIWDSNKLSTAIEALSNESEGCLWFSNSRLINENGENLEQLFNEESPILTLESQLVCGITQGCSMVFNKILYNEIFQKNYQIIPMHDTVIMLHSLINSKIIYENKPYFGYRVHSNNVVAKEGKSKLKKIKNSLNSWFSKKNINLLTNLAYELANKNNTTLTFESNEYLKRFYNSRSNFFDRIWIILNKRTVSKNKKGLRSFKIRTILGII